MAHAFVWDVSDIPSIEERLKEATGILGGLDILVNNAGVIRLPDTTPEENWDYVIDINQKP